MNSGERAGLWPKVKTLSTGARTRVECPLTATLHGFVHVRFGSLADILTSPRHVRFNPNNRSCHAACSGEDRRCKARLRPARAPSLFT